MTHMFCLKKMNAINKFYVWLVRERKMISLREKNKQTNKQTIGCLVYIPTNLIAIASTNTKS